MPGPAGDPALPNNGQQVVAHVHFITFGVFLRIRLCKASSDFLERKGGGKAASEEDEHLACFQVFQFFHESSSP